MMHNSDLPMIDLPSAPLLAIPCWTKSTEAFRTIRNFSPHQKSIHYDNEKKSPEELRYNKYLNRACREVNGFATLLQRFERNISVLGRSPRTFDNYSRHIAALALHFQCLPTDLDPEQVKDYLYVLQQRSKTPSQTYFKHTVYGLRFLLKTEGLPYQYLHLPSIARPQKLPVMLSRQEIWAMLHKARSLNTAAPVESIQ